MGLLADVTHDVVHRMGEFKDGAAKHAIALGIYKLTMAVAGGVFKIRETGIFCGRFIQVVTPWYFYPHCKIRSQTKAGSMAGFRTPTPFSSLPPWYWI